MADSRITELDPVAGAIIADTDEVAIVASGATSRATVAALREAVSGIFGVSLLGAGAAQAISDNSATAVTLYDTEVYDVGGWYDPANPGVVVVPAGVTAIRLTAEVWWGASAAGTRQVYVEVAGGAQAATPYCFNTPDPTVQTRQLLVSGPIPVSPGDTVQLIVVQISGTSQSLIGGGYNWLTVEGA